MIKDDVVDSPLFAMQIQQENLFAIAEILVNRLDLFQTTESVHSVAAFLAGHPSVDIINIVDVIKTMLISESVK